MMFDYFLRIYKTEIYNGKISNLKRFPLSEWFLLTLMFASLITALAFGIRGNNVAYIMVAAGALFLGILLTYDSLYRKKHCDERFLRYKENKLEPLKTMLKREEFNLLSSAKIDWLISCCNKEIADSNIKSDFGDFFLRFIFPIVTLIFGFIAKEISLTDGITIITVIIFAMIVFYLFYKMLLPIVDEIMHPYKDALLFLKSELEYIKTTLED